MCQDDRALFIVINLWQLYFKTVYLYFMQNLIFVIDFYELMCEWKFISVLPFQQLTY